MVSEGYMKMLENKWKDQLPAGYKLKFIESINENGETVLTPQIVKEVEANEKL